MANRNTQGFGLIAQGTVGSTPATGGQGKYFIDAAYNADLFQGTAVKSTAGYKPNKPKTLNPASPKH